jgi:hypothetical protein
MKQLRRRLFNMVASISLLMCLTTTSLAVRSFLGPLLFSWMAWDAPKHLYSAGALFSEQGGLSVSLRSNVITTPNPFLDSLYSPNGPNHGKTHWFGTKGQLPRYGFWRGLWKYSLFRYSSILKGEGPRSQLELTVPYGPLVVLSAFMPLFWLLRFRRTYPPGFCRRCGYDLRATPDRCPECGAVPIKAKIVTV